MSKETLILILSWGISIFLLLWKVPKYRIREAQIVFLFTQSVGWIYVFIQSYFNNISYPYREFPKATDMLFSLHFVIYPTFLVLFILFYPKTSIKWKIFLYYSVFNVLHQLYELLLERYTNLIEFTDWKWYWGILFKFIIYYVIYRFYKWFMKGLKDNSPPVPSGGN